MREFQHELTDQQMGPCKCHPERESVQRLGVNKARTPQRGVKVAPVPELDCKVRN